MYYLRVDLEVIAMEVYSKFSRFQKLESRPQMQFSVIPRKPPFFEVLTLCMGYSQYILSPIDTASKLCLFFFNLFTGDTVKSNVYI